MNNNKNHYVSVESVKNEIKRIMDENERFILGRTDEKEVYAGEVVLTQLRRLLRKYENIMKDIKGNSKFVDSIKLIESFKK